MSICSVKGCRGKYYAKGYCGKHYKQIREFGKIRERTIFDPNEFILDNDTCWVSLYNRKCIEVARAAFHINHYQQIRDSMLKWNLHSKEYAIAHWSDENGKFQHIFLHQAIIQLTGQIVQPGEMIDHIDGDTLNCLDDNLRICNALQNAHNAKMRKDNTSGFIGVMWHKIMRKWQAKINVNKTRIILGFFDTKEDAARAYNAAAIIHHGEFAVLNIIP